MVYMNDKKAIKIMEDCLNEMYLNSTPPITWKEVKDKYVGVDDWYWKHELCEKKYVEIKDKYRKKLSSLYKSSLDWALLDFAPKFKDCKCDKNE